MTARHLKQVNVSRKQNKIKKEHDQETYGSSGSLRMNAIVRILWLLQEMGWQTTLDLWIRTLLVHLVRQRRRVVQELLKDFGIFVDVA
jgi:hypothetical protein